VTRVKICGITDTDDARDAILLGADAIGLNFSEKSMRCIDGSRAAEIIEMVPAFVTIVGVFVNHPNPQSLEDFALSLGLHAVQLHGNESPDYCSMIQRVKFAWTPTSRWNLFGVLEIGCFCSIPQRRHNLAARDRHSIGARLTERMRLVPS
jgi:phosphoribosylanthranilate isomerase